MPEQKSTDASSKSDATKAAEKKAGDAVREAADAGAKAGPQTSALGNVAERDTASASANALPDEASIAKAREQLRKEREQLEADKLDHGRRVEADRFEIASASDQLRERAEMVDYDRRVKAGEVIPTTFAPVHAPSAASALEGLASTRIVQAPSKEEVDTLEDDYTATYRGPFVACARIMVGDGKWIMPGTVIPGGSAPRSELEPLWQQKAIKPYRPEAPEAPRNMAPPAGF